MSRQIPENSLYLHAFNLLPEIGPSRIFKLSEYFKNDFKKAFFANPSELLQAGIEEKIIQKWETVKSNINLDQERHILQSQNIWILTPTDEFYPKLLLEIPKKPQILYIKGMMEYTEEVCIAVVGSRKITDYGRIVIPELIQPLVKTGVVIVSGMAYGVDSEAHKQSIKNNKRTIAVLGGGLDNESIYPKHHQFLAEEILSNGGALISEYPPKTPNFKQNFIARNRIISGLSLGVIVIECGLESGSLITAKYALEQNRQVYAVPGSIYSEMSKGPNSLIKMGAKPITEATDILEDLNLQNLPEEIDNQNIFGDNPTETVLLKLINKDPKTIDELIKTSKLEAGEVASALTFLEMKGKVRNLGGQQYIRSR